MNAVVEMLNAAGQAFVRFSLPMLIQSCVLILILLAVDALLRPRVRAVFRYWIWMLVLVKLVLPPSLGSPVSVGTWFGETLETPAIVLLDSEPRPMELSPVISAFLSGPDSGIAEPIIMPPSTTAAFTAPVETGRPQTPIPIPAVPLKWQGLVLLVWAVVAIALAALLVQRAFFVRGLLGQSEEVNRSMLSELEDCRRRLGLRRRIDLRFSPNATSPAVCGLFRPVILIPRSIASRLQSHDLRAVLLHELAHVKRADLWINLIQTLLQIAYFYNPLLWLANAMIRRTREQAVDETVLVAMGETARQYPEILVNIAKLAFTRRPALSLRLIGVVESKSALTARIRHILNRPIPTTTRLGVFGILPILVVAVVLLPMARARPLPRPEPEVTVPAEEQDRTFVEAPVSSDFVMRLPGGATVEFLGIHDCGSENEVWWRPDGETLPGAPYSYSSYLRSSKPNDTYEALFRISSPAGRTFGEMEWTRGRSTMPGYLHRDGRRGSSDIPDGLFTGVLEGPPEEGQVRIDIGVGLDNAWEPLGSLDGQASEAVTLPDAVINPARQEDGKVVVTVTHRISDKEVRLVAVDRNGSVHEEVGHTIRQGHGIASYEPRFELQLTEISQFRLEAQKLTWTAFKNVSLRAGQKTEVRTLLPDGDRELPAQVEPVTPSTEPRSDATGATGAAGAVVQLSNGATVEFLGIRDRAGGEGRWWRPDGEILSVAPYDDSLVAHGGTPQTTYEVLFRISSPTGKTFAEMEWTAWKFSRYSPLRALANGIQTSNDIPRDTADLLNAILQIESETDRVQIDVGVGLESAWEPLGALDTRNPGVAVTVPGAVINPATEEEGKTSVVASNQFMDRAIRLVAVDKNGFVRKPTRYSFGRRDDASRCEATFDLPLGEIQSIRLEAQKLTRVVFRDVSLRPGQRTDVEIETESTGPSDATVREIVLPEADKRPVVLDLATGELVPLPPVGPEPQKTQQALRELGKGDILYGVDLGDRTLIFLRDSKSEPPGEETGEPSVTGHLIKNPPETITVVTKEGRRYKVTILAADGNSCTLRYSSIPADRGAGGGARVEPEKMDATLELRIAPQVDPDAKQEMHELASAICAFADDHQGNLPATLSALSPYLRDPQARAWLDENVTYVGRGSVNRRFGSSIVTAYEKSPQPTGERHVLFLDYHIELVGSQRLRELNIESARQSDARTLEFRIAPRSIDLDAIMIEKLKQTFSPGGSLPESDFAWFPIRMDLTGQPFAIIHESGGKAYVLLWNKPPYVILASQDWGVESVYRVIDASRRPAIGLTFNDKGASLFHDLTAANVQQNLAIVVEGTAVAMPNISAPLGSRAIITGNFTEQEIGEMMASLRKEVRGQPPQAAQRSDSQTPDDSLLPLDLDVGNPWGEAVEEVRCRLHAVKAVWTSGEVPTLRLDVRNDGTSHKQVFPPSFCVIQVDGEWFMTSSVGTGTNLLAGKALTDLPLQLDRTWRRVDGLSGEDILRSLRSGFPLPGPPVVLALAPGTHTVTAAVRVEPRTIAPGEPRCLAVVSNPVQIEVVSKAPGDKLELRVAPRLIDISTDVVERCRNALVEGQPPEDGGYLWIPIRPGANPPDAFVETHAGKLSMLVHNTEPFIMVPSQGWKIAYVGRATDQSGRPMVRLEFDSAGAERMQQLTKANNNRPLAMVVNGMVVSAPSISSGDGGIRCAVIVGNFTEQEVEGLIAVLREDINRQSAPPDAGWMDLGEPIPADANDARTLAPGVVLEAIGQDVEGKVFVSSVRDLDATAGREYRFVIRWKDGRGLEPRYLTTGDWFGRGLWEKFTFDAWYNHRQIESIHLQSRVVQEGRGPTIPLPKDEITIAAGTTKPAPSTVAPPGRYALSFGQESDYRYLYVPDSESLRKPNSLTIETWIKPQFGPGPYEQRPGWGILAKGAYTGARRVRVQGFGIAMDNFDPNDNTVMFVRYQAIEHGVGAVDTRMKLPADWVHITMPFDGYIPAPGQPLVIGLPLTPGDNAFCGQIAEVRIWDGTRAPDIRQYENKALTGDEPGLVACWTFEEGSGQIAHDISPNANHARLGSSVVVDDADPAWIDLRVALETPREISGGMSGLTNTAASAKDLRAVARDANYKVGPEWFEAAESADNHVYQSVHRYAEQCGEPGFHQVLDDWVRWKYKLDAITDTGSATALFANFCGQFDQERRFDARQGDPRIRAIGLICDKLNTQMLMDQFVKAVHTRKSFYSSCDDDVGLSIDDRQFTGHEGDVLPASLSAVWYALRRADEKMDDLDPLGQNVIEDELTPILIREYKRQERPDLLDRAVLLGGPEVAEFLLKQDWRDVSDEHNRELYRGAPTWYVNKWLLRLIHLDDPAGEKFRRDHPEFVSLFADIWAQSHRLIFEFQIPRFLLLDKDKGTDSFAWWYWPTFTKKAESMGLFWFKKLELEFNYLQMLEPHATTQMYADCWIQVIDESEGMFWNPRDIIEKSVPVPRRRPLATLLVNAIEERLRKTGTWDEDDRIIGGGLESYRWILKEFLAETAG